MTNERDSVIRFCFYIFQEIESIFCFSPVRRKSAPWRLGGLSGNKRDSAWVSRVLTDPLCMPVMAGVIWVYVFLRLYPLISYRGREGFLFLPWTSSLGL